ncbi:hypothetical protein EDD15DRAFT_2203958 [Pisolithus albus]|nr:hypothetical protein EDD15DRAFT_2203958 [Pisolithus albus]
MFSLNLGPLPDSDSSSDFDIDNTTAEKDNGGMSDDDILGNPSQSMDVETSGTPVLGEEHNQVGAVKGEGKRSNDGMSGRVRIWELQDLQYSIESKIRANIWQELGKIVESSVATASEKALPDLMNHRTESSAGPSSSPTSKFTSKKTKKLPKSRAPCHNEFKVDELGTHKSVRELGQRLAQTTKVCHGPLVGGKSVVGIPSMGHVAQSKRLPCSGRNKSAVLVFAAEYMRRRQGHQGETHTLEDVWKACLIHVMALRMQYKHKRLDELDEKERKARNRRRQRKHEACYQTTYTCFQKSKTVEAGAWPHFTTTSLNESKGAWVLSHATNGFIQKSLRRRYRGHGCIFGGILGDSRGQLRGGVGNKP